MMSKDTVARLIALLGIFSIIAGPRTALACKCAAPPDPAAALERSAAVFRGVTLFTIELPPRGKGHVPADPIEYTFFVEAAWKGELGETVTLRTQRESSACGYEFSEGETYLVYALPERDEDGFYQTTICTRTAPLSAAEEDLGALPEPEFRREEAGEVAGHVAFLMELGKDRDSGRSIEAIRALGHVRPGSDAVIEYLESVFAGALTRERIAAVEALGDLRSVRPEVADFLGRGLSDESDSVRFSVATALYDDAAHQPAALYALWEAQDEINHELYRGRARNFVRRNEEMTTRLLPMLCRDLVDHQAETRGRSISVLQWLRVEPKETVPYVVGFLEDPDADIRIRTARLLGSFGLSGREALPQLKRALDDPEPYVRKEADQAIRLIEGR